MESPNLILEKKMPIISQSESAKSQFLQRTYSHLALSILGFIIIEALFLNTEWIVKITYALTEGYLMLFLLLIYIFGTSFAEEWALTATDKASQYFALIIYIVITAFIFVPIIYRAIVLTGDVSLIYQTSLLTISLFIAISLIAFFSRRTFSMLRNIVIIVSILALGLIVLGIIFDFSLGLWFSIVMVGAAAGSILYKTSDLLNDYHSEQYIAASLNLFASLALLFRYILRILSLFSRR